MKRFNLGIVFLSAALLSATCFADAQTSNNARTLIREDLSRAASNLHSYEFKEIADTPAPEGFLPVYISHYGRHGSRYDVSSSSFSEAEKYLRTADSLGTLTSEGKRLLAAVTALFREHQGMEGELAPRGGREHQALAERMSWRFPQVFSSPGRQDVHAVSSTMQRCLVSMANFTSSLKGVNPGIRLDMTTGDRFAPVIRLSGAETRRTAAPTVGENGPGTGGNRTPGVAAAGPGGAGRAGGAGGPGGQGTAGRGGQRGSSDAASKLEGDYSSFLGKVFKDPGNTGLSSTDGLIRSVFRSGALCQDLDFLGLDIYRDYFTPEELYALWTESNDSVYERWGNSIENGYRISKSAQILLDDIIGKADKALQDGSSTAADLRFGHDMGYLALCGLLGIDSRDGKRYPVKEAHEGWYSFDIVPMAANVQFIFYRNAGGDVLFKILRNEEEVPIRVLTPVEGPYYEWEDFKACFGRKEIYSLDFNKENFILMSQTVTSPKGSFDVTYRAYMHIPYVSNPVDADYQSLCIFEPVMINGRAVDASSSPIIFSNRVGGYLPVDDSMTTDAGGRSGGEKEAYALAEGMVVVVPGCRGRTLADDEGHYYGKAPSVIVDLKAAVRYLRYNAGKVPGNTERIVSIGCSAGGAVSATLGASGNSPLFEPYLNEIGAAPGRDDFFAVGVFSPIMDIQHADMAYEWEFGDVPYQGQLVDRAASKELKEEFAAYEKSLNLKGINKFGRLTADNLGEYIARYWLNPAASLYVGSLSDSERERYLQGKDWMNWDGTSTSFSMKDYNT